jgi:hypothetical protein
MPVRPVGTPCQAAFECTGKRKTESMPGTKANRVKLGARQASLRVLDQYDAPVDEVLREEVRASMADKGPSVPIEEVFKRARAQIARKPKATARGA